MKRPSVLLLCLLLPIFGTAGGLHQLVQWDWGPFSAKWVDVNTNQRVRVLGPVWETIDAPDGDSFTALRPFFSQWENETGNRRGREIVWPVYAGKQLENDASWRFVIAYYRNADVTDPDGRYRFWLLPVYFQGRNVEGESYYAIFPLGGTIREFLTYDKVSFALFPLHLRTRLGATESRSWLWPVFSKTKGPRVERFRVFPFYGWSKTRDVMLKTFVMWPFWNSVKYDFNGSKGQGWILFPVTGHLKLSDQETWWVIPPLFRYSKDGDQQRVFGPWPFFQKSSGTVDKFYLWPLFGSKTIGSVTKRFALWPIMTQETIDAFDHVTSRLFVLPFLQIKSVTPKGGDPRVLKERYVKIWPLGSHHSKGPAQKTRIPDLNPTRAQPIERNYAPFWHLFRQDRHGENVDTEVLWGMYRSAIRGEKARYRSVFPLVDWGNDTEGARWNVLKGLVGSEKKGDVRSWRFLYFLKFGGKKTE